MFLVFISSNFALADQVVLKNGDRVTGSIVKKEGKTLTVKTDLMGTVSMDWDQVASIRTDKPVNLVLEGARAVAGPLTTRDGKIEIAASTGTVSAALADVTAIRDTEQQAAYERLQNPSWLQLWAGSATLGFAGTSGNAHTLTFTTGVNAARVTNTDKTSIYFNAIKASASVNGVNADTAQAVRGGIGYDHNIRPRLFANVFNDWEYDRFQNLDLRFVFGGGLGFHAIKNDRSVLDLVGGADYNHSSFSTPLTRNAAELYWGDDYSFKMNSSTSLVQSYRMFNDLSDTGNFRVNFDIGATTKITKYINWNVSLSDRYLRHPAPGRKTNDFLYTTGLGVTFAR